MSELRADHSVALRFLMTEELYLVDPIDSVIARTNQAEVIPPSPAPSVDVSETVSFDYLGENNKYFAILVNYPGQQYMAAKELEALKSILGAKKMHIEDVALVNLHKYPSANFHQLKTFLASNRVVIFGIPSQQIQLPAFPLNQISEHEGVKVLVTFAFSEMMTDVEKKKAFWNVMKVF
ncbi:hypothetical protein [Desertivirga arenae]|uniref:hypothetical protein n=1 Tax=Desertivirga arenae TaxID=2810309 RepID=UPI001A97CEC4|nr:hypothetical protein [Pedobacter sp. SYSU D00823]